MVGFPKNSKCSTCRQRKVKCDERRPVCSQYSLLPYLGSSEALDASIRCLLHHHGNSSRRVVSSATFRSSRGSLDDDTRLYSIALHRLQQAIQDTEECYASTTLAAIAALAIAEFIQPAYMGTKFVTHCDGLTTMLRLRGPARCRDDDLSRAVVLGVLGVCAMCGDVLFGGDDWPLPFFDPPGLTYCRSVFFKLEALVYRCGALLPETRSVHQRINSGELSLENLVARALAIRSAFYEIGKELAAQRFYRQKPSELGDQEVPLCYEFDDFLAMQINIAWWSGSVAINAATNQLHANLSAMLSLGSSTRAVLSALGPLVAQNVADCWTMSEHICRSFECVLKWAPLESVWAVLLLCLTYGFFCHRRKPWVIAAVNKLYGGAFPHIFYDAQKMEQRWKYFTGVDVSLT
ncbi:hypothetical protein PG990_012509 [Apiospora arundinis]